MILYIRTSLINKIGIGLHGSGLCLVQCALQGKLLVRRKKINTKMMINKIFYII
jgi:hypothetical protein